MAAPEASQSQSVSKVQDAADLSALLYASECCRTPYRRHVKDLEAFRAMCMRKIRSSRLLSFISLSSHSLPLHVVPLLLLLLLRIPFVHSSISCPFSQIPASIFRTYSAERQTDRETANTVKVSPNTGVSLGNVRTGAATEKNTNNNA